MNAELTHDAGKPSEFPTRGLPEVAILGRSNVGKSSFINAVVRRRKLARTSSTPGKTRRIQFYLIERSAYIVDLPGFGYAAVSKAERRTWRPMVESYLRGSRKPLQGALLLVDTRRGPEQEEFDLLEWLELEGIPAKLVVTKSDKLSASEAARQFDRIQAEVSLAAEDLALVSSRTRRGLETAAAWLEAWTGVSF